MLGGGLTFLVECIRNTVEFTGISVDTNESKLSLYADDLCAFCSDYNSVELLFDILKQFYKCLSLIFHREKTEILKVGKHQGAHDVRF